MEERIGQVIEGALAAVAPVALAPRPIVVRPPWINSLALASGTLEWTIFPSERMDIGLTLLGVKEVVDVREHRHG